MQLSLAGLAAADQGDERVQLPAKQPRRGGTLNYAGAAAGSYNNRGVPLDPNTSAQFGAKSFSLYDERLLGYDPQTYAVQPELAQKWEQPSPTEYVFSLQPNVKWQNKAPVNGRALKVEGILCSLERARTNDPRFISRSLLSFVDRVEAFEWKQPKDDAAKEALSLLNAAGFTKDNPLKFKLTVQSGGIIPTAAQLLQAQWTRLRQDIVDSQLRLLGSNALSAARAHRSFEYMVTGHSAGMVDPDIWLTPPTRRAAA